ncbi:MAG: PKD domain-containing protein [Bacteroidota bacterium]
MNRRAFLLFITLVLSLPFHGIGQSCVIKDLANTMTKDQLCSPVQVHWNVSYEDVNDAGTTVEIHYDWDDGSSETITATEGPAGTFTTDANHTYISQDDVCNYDPVATLIVNGVMCTSSSQAQIVTVWDTDNENGGEVNAEPNVYPICVGNGATMQFDDGTLFNCVPPQENDMPNEDTRWIQWVYGTDNTMSSATEVMVDGVVRPYPWEGPVITLPGPVHGSGEQSLPITVADDNLIGEEFEVELRYWNYCNPYLPGMPSEPAEIDRSVIRIVGNPDATITPVDTMCQFNNNIILVAATGGGTWSGNGIINTATGEFAPYVATPGTHEIRYDITDNNACSSFDTVQITVRDAPDGIITPVDPFCIYDAPYDLEAIPPQGTWSGDGITDVITGMFDPAIAGIGSHDIVFTTETDAYGCSGVDSVVVHVVDLPNAEIVTSDSAWCEQSNNQSMAEILITGSDTSSFDLVVEIKGTLDTLFNLSVGTFSLFLNNQVGRNEYVLNKIIEHHGSNSCDNDLNDTLIMEVHPRPDMTVSANYDDWCSPVDVEFISTEGYEKYYWNFGDDDSTMTRTSSIYHTYTIPSRDSLFYVDAINGDTLYFGFQTDTTYHFQLVIESFFGCRDTITDSVHIYETPVADFFVSPEIQNFPETHVYLINTSSYGDWSYFWDFGDGETDVVKDPNEHEYEIATFYDIELKTYNEFCRDSITKRVQILPPPPVALFEPDSIGCPPLEIQFSNTSEYADSYIWDFDDGTFSTESNPSHIFYQSKEHHVKLAAFGMSGSDTVEHIITIHETPTALFNAYPNEAKDLKQIFKFVNNSIKATNYLWDFGDGNTSPEENATHIYGEEGTFTVTLYVWSENDCPDTLIQESLIRVIAGEGNAEFPNAFVWNGSGPTGGHWTEGTIDNTVFHPNVINATQFRMIIYTRWGEMIWETNEVYVGWDGYLKSGELASPGVYVYKAWVTYISGTKELLTGDITFLH